MAALVLGSQRPLELLLVNGAAVVERDTLVTADTDVVAREVKVASTRLLDRAGVTR